MWKIVIVLVFSLSGKKIFLLLFKHSNKRFIIFFTKVVDRQTPFIAGLVADLQESLLVKRIAPAPAGRPCSFFFLHWIICHVLLYVSHSFNTCFYLYKHSRLLTGSLVWGHARVTWRRIRLHEPAREGDADASIPARRA